MTSGDQNEPGPGPEPDAADADHHGAADADAVHEGLPAGDIGDPEAGPGTAAPEAATAPRRSPAAIAVARDRTAHPPFAAGNAIGDAGRQTEVVAAPGPLTVGIADTELDFATVDPFVVRACATRGLGHRHSGTPRQDAFAIACDEKWLVVAVADGVSQCEWSHVAATTAARATCKLVLGQAGRTDSIDWPDVSRRVSLRIVKEAEYRQLVDVARDAGTPDTGVDGAGGPDAAGVDHIDDRVARCRRIMSCTLVVGVVGRRPGELGGFPVELAVLAGDSGAYVLDDAGLRRAAGGKDDGDSPITSSAVRPLPGIVTPERTTFILGEDQVLLLVTDGLGDPIGDGTGEVGRELARRWRQPPTIDRFLLDVNFLRRTFDDDRTAVALWPLPRTSPTT
jgi:hypothetical protein